MKLPRTLLMALLYLPFTLLAQDNTLDYIGIGDAYIRELPPSVKNTAVYMSITNDSEAAIRIVGVSSELAESAMLHRTAMENNMMTMQHVMFLEIAAGQTLLLEPGALHIMLTGLKTSLRAGDSVPLILEFDNGLNLALNVPVVSL